MSTWTTNTCLVVGAMLGLLLGLVGCDDTGPSTADAQRAWQRQIERTPTPVTMVGDGGEEWPTVTGPYSVGAIR